MSNSIKKFYEALSNDGAIRSRLNALNEKYKGMELDENTAARETAVFAKSEGFEFTAEELIEYAKSESKTNSTSTEEQPVGELSDEELDAATGGLLLTQQVSRDLPTQVQCIKCYLGTALYQGIELMYPLNSWLYKCTRCGYEFPVLYKGDTVLG